MINPIVGQSLRQRVGDVFLADQVGKPLGAVAAVEGLRHVRTLTRGSHTAPSASTGREGTPRAPDRARLPLLPSGPGGVRRDNAARGVGIKCTRAR